MVFGRRKQEAAGEPPGDAVERSRLTPVDVQQKVFRLAFRGYNEQDVDGFLDQITEELASLHEENKRLREDLDLQGPGEGTGDARRHAEEIIRRAREEAARITAGGAGAAGAAPSASYLVREREFLHQLAGLVQGHAETLKAEARRARTQTEEAGEQGAAPEGEPEEAEEPEEPEEPAEEPSAEERPDPPVPPAEGSPDPALEDTAAMPPPAEPGELAEWTNPFVGEEGGEGPAELEVDENDDQEPSLRELFWGEE